MRQLVVRFRLKRGSTQQKCFYVHDTQDENKKENWKKKRPYCVINDEAGIKKKNKKQSEKFGCV